jgi:hypothetical protein
MDANGFHTNKQVKEENGEGRGKKRKIALRVKSSSFFLGLVPLFYSNMPLLSIRNRGGRWEIDSPTMIRSRTHALFTHRFQQCKSGTSTSSSWRIGDETHNSA